MGHDKLDSTFDSIRRSCELALHDEWDKWAAEIPFIPFPAGWLVRPIPPLLGAIVRFQVLLPEMHPEDRVSVYLDCYGRLGFFGTPESGPQSYWEVYPVRGDVGRCAMRNVDKLLEMIADRGAAAKSVEDMILTSRESCERAEFKEGDRNG